MKLFLRACSGVLLMTVVVAAQAAPNLSGTWVVDSDRTAALRPAPAAGGGGGGGGMVAMGGASGAPPEWVITQTAAALTIVRALADGTQQKHVYKLDGSESVNVNGRTTQKSKSTVAGGKVTTVGTQTVATDQGEVSSEFKEVRSLDKDGAMVVEMTRTANGSARTTTTVFAKKK